MKNQSKQPQFSLDVIQKDSMKKKQLDGFIEEVILSQDKIKREKEALRDIFTEAKDSLGIPRKVLNKLVKERTDPGTIEAEARDLEEIQQIAEVLDPPAQAQFGTV